MKKILLFTAMVLFHWTIAQNPIFTHYLNSTTSGPDFNLSSTGVSLSEDYFLRANQAVKFQGTHTGLSLDFSSYTSLRSEGSVEFFHKHISDGTSNDYQGDTQIFHLNNGVTATGGILKSAISFGIKGTTYIVKGSSGTSNSNMSLITDNNSAKLNLWQHFIITYKFGSGGYIKVYRNGSLIIDKSFNYNAPGAMTNKMVFNGYINNTNGAVVGSGTSELDQVMVYNQILSDTQVVNKYISRYPLQKGTQAIKYTFNNSYDDQIGNQNLIIPSGITLGYANGATLPTSNKAGSFNNHVSGANTYASVPTTINNSLQNTYTISFAYKQYTTLNDNSSNGTIPIIFIPTTDSTKPLIIGIVKNNSATKYPLAMQFGSSRIAANNFLGSVGEWVHATVVFDSGTMKVYINGELVLTSNISTHIYTPNPNGNIQIGKSNSPNDWFRGLIDDVVIDNKAYTAAEAKALYAHHLGNSSNYDTTLSSNEETKYDKKETVGIYPNPTSDELIINGNANYKNIKVLNSAAQIVNVKVDNRKIQVRHLKAGTYYLYFEDSTGKSYTKPFIKK